MYSGFAWVRIGACWGLSQKRDWIFDFSKSSTISWLPLEIYAHENGRLSESGRQNFDIRVSPFRTLFRTQITFPDNAAFGCCTNTELCLLTTFNVNAMVIACYDLQNRSYAYNIQGSSNTLPKRLRWSRGSVLAFSIQVRGFKPGRSRRIFKGEKNSQHAFLRRGSKAVGPMS
jgi:hypothetical protein